MKHIKGKSLDELFEMFLEREKKRPNDNNEVEIARQEGASEILNLISGL